MYLPDRRANVGLLENLYTVTGKVHPLPADPQVSSIALLDALPHLAINLHRAPIELLDRLFDLTQLTIKIHYQSNETPLRVVFPTDGTAALATIAEVKRL